MHPQTIFDTAERTRLRSARATTHVVLADNLDKYLKRWRSQTIAGSNVAGFAAATRIWGDRQEDTQAAIQALDNHFQSAWAVDRDLQQSADILNGAIGYDVLYDLITPIQRTKYKNTLAHSAKDLADAADAGEWWTSDLVQNHNWVNIRQSALPGRLSKAKTQKPNIGVQ